MLCKQTLRLEAHYCLRQIKYWLALNNPSPVISEVKDYLKNTLAMYENKRKKREKRKTRDLISLEAQMLTSAMV